MTPIFVSFFGIEDSCRINVAVRKPRLLRKPTDERHYEHP